jgi:hypothetical protein
VNPSTDPPAASEAAKSETGQHGCFRTPNAPGGYLPPSEAIPAPEVAEKQPLSIRSEAVQDPAPAEPGDRVFIQTPGVRIVARDGGYVYESRGRSSWQREVGCDTLDEAVETAARQQVERRFRSGRRAAV